MYAPFRLLLSFFCASTGYAGREHAGVQHAHTLLLGGGHPVAGDALLPDPRWCHHPRVPADAVSAAVGRSGGARTTGDTRCKGRGRFFFGVHFFFLNRSADGKTDKEKA